MRAALTISVGQHSDKGRKDINQDFHGVLIPTEPLLSVKGIAVAIADGISTSNVSHVASESSVKSFLTDYYCTAESWSVKTSAHRVLAATNSWLHSQTRQSQYSYDKDKGYVCTFSALVIKSTTAHIFHVGDSRIYRIAGKSLELLTEDHRIIVSSQQSYLGRALGINPQVEIDYLSLPVQEGDIFVLATDGVYEHLEARAIVSAINDNATDLDQAAHLLVQAAFAHGSNDNMTIQIVRIEALPDGEADEIIGDVSQLPLPQLLDERAIFDGFRIVRELRGSSRSHVYLALDVETEALVVIKIPSVDLRGNPEYLRRFMMEEWCARRLNSPYVLKPYALPRRRNFLYSAMEYIEGQTLTQWMIDNPKPDLETVRNIVEQIARGLGAFHRMEMLHQDLRPENIMIDRTGTAKIIDFGSTKVAGVVEAAPAHDMNHRMGTAQYSAPENFLAEPGSSRSDLFSLGVVTYQMMTGRLPYGAEIARARTRSQFSNLTYHSASLYNPDVPVWVDRAIEKAVHPDARKRHEDLSAFVFDLRHPNPKYLAATTPPLLERNPVLVWQGLSFILACIVVALLIQLHGH
jgi:serine/threonine protein phosphatase PrpC